MDGIVKPLTAASVINSPKVFVVGGKCYCESAPQLISRTTKDFLRVVPQESKKLQGSIAYLLKKSYPDRHEFFVSFNKKPARLIYTLPIIASVDPRDNSDGYGIINNLGGGEFVSLLFLFTSKVVDEDLQGYISYRRIAAVRNFQEQIHDFQMTGTGAGDTVVGGRLVGHGWSLQFEAQGFIPLVSTVDARVVASGISTFFGLPTKISALAGYTPRLVNEDLSASTDGDYIETMQGITPLTVDETFSNVISNFYLGYFNWIGNKIYVVNSNLKDVNVFNISVSNARVDLQKKIKLDKALQPIDGYGIQSASYYPDP